MPMCVEAFKCRPNQRNVNNTNSTPCRDTWLVVLVSYWNLNQSFYPCMESSVYFAQCSLFVGSACRLKPRCLYITLLFVNHREKKFFLGITYIRRFVCIYVCMCVHSITATPFNLELWNFGIWFLVWSSKNGFLKFLKKYFFPELLPFFYFSLRFLCNFEE